MSGAARSHSYTSVRYATREGLHEDIVGVRERYFRMMDLKERVGDDGDDTAKRDDTCILDVWASGVIKAESDLNNLDEQVHLQRRRT